MPVKGDQTLEPTHSRLGNALAVGATAALLVRELELPTLVSYAGPRALVVVVLALLLALLCLTRLRPLVAAGTLALALLWLAVAFTPLTLWASSDLSRRDMPRPADAVFVLSSRLQEDGELTTSAMSRLLHGLELLAQEQAPRLVLSELAPPYRAYAPAARSLMTNLGMHQELLTVGPVRNTRDEAVQVARLFAERGWRTVLLVTSPWHVRRAAAAFAQQGLIVISSPGVETRYDAETLTSPDERLFAFGTLLHERVGIEVYKRMGWIK
jgi:uncharacterized SAM-binding protein YcdF (DUF218 family)